MPKSKHRRKPKGQGSAQSGRETAAAASATGATTIQGDAAEPRPKKKVGIAQFFRQVRDEAQKITWTSRNEMIVSTIMVLIMVAIASLFFFAVDSVLRWIVPMILALNI